MGSYMKEVDLDIIADLITDIFESYEASFVEAIYILDRIKHNYHSSLDEIVNKNEDTDTED